MSILQSNAMPLLFLFAIIFAAFYLAPYQMLYVLLKFRHTMTEIELYPLRFFYEYFYVGDITHLESVRNANLNWLGKYTYNAHYAISEVNRLLDDGIPYKIWSAVRHFYYLSYPDLVFIITFLFIGGFWYKKYSEATIFTKKHNMDTLIIQEQELYPEIKLAYKHNLLDSNQVDDNWYFPLTEIEFINKYDLLKKGRGKDNQKTDDFGNVFQRLDINKTKEVFMNQLDKRFNGFHRLSPHRKFIYAMLGVMWNVNVSSSTDSEKLEINYKDSYLLNFGRRFNNKIMENGGKYADELIEEMFEEIKRERESIKDEKGRKKICEFDFTNFDDWAQKCYNRFSTLERYQKYVENRHAYELTAMASLMQGAYYFQGVFSHSLFQWLKSIDRNLYFVLAGVGYQRSYFVEVAGIFAHWETEKNTGVPHITKKVIAAIEGLEEAQMNFKEGELGADGLV